MKSLMTFTTEIYKWARENIILHYWQNKFILYLGRARQQRSKLGMFFIAGQKTVWCLCLCVYVC